MSKRASVHNRNMHVIMHATVNIHIAYRNDPCGFMDMQSPVPSMSNYSLTSITPQL